MHAVGEDPFFPQQPLGFVPVFPPAGPDDELIGACLLIAGERPDHRLVEMGGAEAAAVSQNQRPFIHPELTAGLFPVHKQEIPPKRIAGDDHVRVLRQVLPGGLIADEDGFGHFGEHFHRHPRIGVGLMHHHRDPHPRSLAQDRAADIAACPDGDIRTKIPENAGGGAPRRHSVERGGEIPSYVFYAELPLETAHVHRFQRVSRRRHELCLHPARCPHEQDIRVRPFIPDRRRDG